MIGEICWYLSLTAPFFGYGAVSGVSLSYALSFRLRARKEQNMKFRKRNFEAYAGFHNNVNPVFLRAFST